MGIPWAWIPISHSHSVCGVCVYGACYLSNRTEWKGREMWSCVVLLLVGGAGGGGAGYSHQSSHQKLLWLIRVWREMHPHRHHHPHTPSLPQARRSVARPVASALRPAGAGSLDINQGRMSVRTGWRGLGGCWFYEGLASRERDGNEVGAGGAGIKQEKKTILTVKQP